MVLEMTNLEGSREGSIFLGSSGKTLMSLISMLIWRSLFWLVFSICSLHYEILLVYFIELRYLSDLFLQGFFFFFMISMDISNIFITDADETSVITGKISNVKKIKK